MLVLSNLKPWPEQIVIAPGLAASTVTTAPVVAPKDVSAVTSPRSSGLTTVSLTVMVAVHVPLPPGLVTVNVTLVTPRA